MWQWKFFHRPRFFLSVPSPLQGTSQIILSNWKFLLSLPCFRLGNTRASLFVTRRAGKLSFVAWCASRKARFVSASLAMSKPVFNLS